MAAAEGREVMPEPDTGSSVRITLRDVYEAVQQVQKELAAGMGKMDAHVQQPNHQGTQLELIDHENRLRKLEKVAWMALGIALVFSPALTIVLYFASQKP